MRTEGFEKHNWFSVWRNFEADFNKPPVHYWTAALLSKTGVSSIMALKLISYVSALLSILFLAYLARSLYPGDKWLPAYVAIVMSSSGIFAVNAISALLDTFQLLFLVVTILLLAHALKTGRHWYLFGFCCGLASLQKAPVALFVSIVAVAILYFTKSQYLKYQLQDDLVKKKARNSFLLAVFITVSWPLFQTVHFGIEAINRMYRKEILNRFAPSISNDKSEPFVWVQWLCDDLLFVLIILALGFAFFLFKHSSVSRKDKYLVCGLAIVALLFTMAGGKIYSRYIILVLPLLCIASGRVLAYAPRGFLMISTLSLLTWSIGFNRPIPSQKEDHRHYAESMVGHVTPADSAIVYAYDEHRRIKAMTMFMYFANKKGKRLIYYKPHLEKSMASYNSRLQEGGSFLGVSHYEQELPFDGVYGTYETLEIYKGHRFWRFTTFANH